MWLTEPAIAGAVARSIGFAGRELDLYDLQAWVVMPNHVHLVVSPHVEMWKITKAVKGYSAKEANLLLGRTGQPFWQSESFDRWVRDRWEMARIVRYVEENPVKAGLTTHAEQWPWSSASRRTVRG